MTTLNWQNLRTWNGSQNSAFEELCCQLARHEIPVGGITFIRKATPDAGIECFWQLSNGDEHGWQAKFFVERPKSTQWQQIDKSIKTALEKHPRLTKYTVCLPVDRDDPRQGRKSLMTEWSGRVAKWTQWAEAKDLHVDFVYWGEHEIFERLSREEHRGRHLFWFHERLLSPEWFQNQVSRAANDAQTWPMPGLNIELSISQVFDGLGRTESFYLHLQRLERKLEKKIADYATRSVEEPITDKFVEFQRILVEISSILKNITERHPSKIDFEELGQVAIVGIEAAREMEELILDKIRSIESILPDDKETLGYDKRTAGWKWLRSDLADTVHSILHELHSFSRSSQALLANTPALLLIGTMGSGKTHLLCEIAKKRTEVNLPTILLVGRQFRNAEPWSQFREWLDLGSITTEDLLGALEVAAETQNSRALILIDALNEGEGPRVWPKYLSGFLTTLSRFSRIALAISVREPYQHKIIPNSLLDEKKLIVVEHQGFSGFEYIAMKAYFEHFGIVAPTIPILHPEFKNPLFLLLFCKALRNLGISELPRGVHGITQVFNYFLNSVNEKLAREYDFNPQANKVQKAVLDLAKVMADRGVDWLSVDEAEQIVNSHLPQIGFENSLYWHLIAEGLLTQFLMKENGTDINAIRFSYERFSSHIIATYLLDTYLDASHPEISFQPTEHLGSLLNNESHYALRFRLIEAFSVQIPERTGRELYEVAPYVTQQWITKDAFIDSLVWRHWTHSEVPSGVRDYINSEVITDKYNFEKLLKAHLTTATIPDTPLNARLLHRILKDNNLPNRDSWWSVFLHEEYKPGGEYYSPITGLIDWAVSTDTKGQIDEEIVQLAAVTLSWFLTSSNRYLRDRATKGLINLLTPHIEILRWLIEQFLSVDDPYVMERLFAIAYGCALRGKNDPQISDLASSIYEWVFQDGEPPANVLLRDYARGVIEVASVRGLLRDDIDIKKARPPYKSEWITKPPSAKRLKALTERKEAGDSIGWLYASIMHWDFGTYIVNSVLDHWTFHRRGSRTPSPKDYYEEFLKALTQEQRALLQEYESARDQIKSEIIRAYFRLMAETYVDQADSNEEEGATNPVQQNIQSDKEVVNVDLVSLERRFQRDLDKETRSHYRKFVRSYVLDPHKIMLDYKGKYAFPAELAKRWILQKVFDLGWTEKRFGTFDRYVNWNVSDRRATKPERIGKKYQWIALYELLARIADNFIYEGRSWEEEEHDYDGPWQIGIRNIDPTWLIEENAGGIGDEDSSWWFNVQYKEWNKEAGNLTWLQTTEDLPDPKLLIQVSDPLVSKEWLNLKMYSTWIEPIPAIEDKYEEPRRELWYLIMSYLVRRSDTDQLYEWLLQQDFWGRWMPQDHDLYEVFWGELYWSSAFRHQRNPRSGYVDWDGGSRNSKVPFEIAVTTDEYRFSSGYDASVERATSYIPSRLLARVLEVQSDTSEGMFTTEAGEHIAYDPSIRERGPAAFLVRPDHLRSGLEREDYDIVWTILGEKRIIGGGWGRENWEGSLRINGAYRLVNYRLEGHFSSRFVSPNSD